MQQENKKPVATEQEMVYCPWCRQDRIRGNFLPLWHAPDYPALVRCRVCGTVFVPKEQQDQKVGLTLG